MDKYDKTACVGEFNNGGARVPKCRKCALAQVHIAYLYGGPIPGSYVTPAIARQLGLCPNPQKTDL